VNCYLALIDQEAEASKRVREAQRALDAKVAAKYKALSEDEIKTLVVDDKWLATLAADVRTELDRVSQALTAASRRWRSATPRRCRNLPRTSRLCRPCGRAPGRMGSHGSEARLQAHRGGVIPEAWDVKPLRQISPVQSVGLVINPSSYFDDKAQCRCS